MAGIVGNLAAVRLPTLQFFAPVGPKMPDGRQNPADCCLQQQPSVALAKSKRETTAARNVANRLGYHAAR